MKRLLPIAAALALAVAGGAWMMSRPAGESLVTPAFADTAPAADAAMAPDYSEGDPNAPVHIVEYASFTCPHCAHFHDDVYKQLRTDYVDTGKVYFTLREVYFDQYGLMAGQIARCGGEMRYYGITDMLFHTQKDWIGSGKGDEIAANLRKLGRVAGLSDEQIDACLADEANAQAMVNAFQVHFTEDGIEGTPTFIVNGKLYQNPGTYENMKKIVDEALAAAGN